MATPYAGGTFTIDGLDDLREALRRAEPVIEGACAAGLFRLATSYIAESVPLVPWDTGALAGSHFVQPPMMDAEGWYVELGYGSASIVYAVIQHEREDFHHPRGGQAHYLSDVLLRHAPTMGAELAVHVRWFVRRQRL